jgi:hypothetical protein
LHFPRQRRRQLVPVDGMDDVEQRDGFADLVSLQRPIRWKPQIGKTAPQIRPLSLRLLDPVLAEIQMAGLKNRLDRLRRMGLGHHDQRHGARRAAGGLLRVSHLAQDLRESGARAICVIVPGHRLFPAPPRIDRRP